MMTPEERATQVWGKMRGVMACYQDENISQITEAIAAAYEDAAQIAQSYGIGKGINYKNLPRACEDIAAAIQSRASGK